MPAIPILLHDASVIAAPSGTFVKSLLIVNSRFRPVAEMDKSFAKASDPNPRSNRLNRIVLRILMTKKTALQALAPNPKNGKLFYTI